MSESKSIDGIKDDLIYWMCWVSSFFSGVAFGISLTMIFLKYRS